MKNVDILAQYREYLITERDASENTMSSYMRDLRQLQEYLQQENGSTLQEVNDTDLQAYIEHLREAGKSVSTIARNIASWKNFYQYLILQNLIEENPARSLSAGKAEHKLPEILTNKEVELLLQQPKATDAKGTRDKAMLELMYATGIRVSELIDLNVSDVNLPSGSIRCFSKNRERFIPMYPYAVSILRDYMDHVRASLVERRAHVTSGILENHQVLPEQSKDQEGHHTSYAASFLRGSFTGKRCRSEVSPEDARTL